MATEAAFILMLIVGASHRLLKSDTHEISVFAHCVMGACTIWGLAIMFLIVYARMMMTVEPKPGELICQIWSCRYPMGAITLTITVALMVMSIVSLPILLNFVPVCFYYLVMIAAVVTYGSAVSWNLARPDPHTVDYADRFLAYYSAPPSWCFGVVAGLLSSLFDMSQDLNDVDRDKAGAIFRALAGCKASLLVLLVISKVITAFGEDPPRYRLFLAVAIIPSLAVMFGYCNVVYCACYMIYSSVVLIEMKKSFLDPCRIISAVMKRTGTETLKE